MMRITAKKVLLVALLASLTGVTVKAVTKESGPRVSSVVLADTIQQQAWTWQAPRTSPGQPLAYYRWQTWVVGEGLLREGTTKDTQVTVDFNRKVLGGKSVFLRVEWVSTKGKVSSIGDSPHLLVEPMPVVPPDTVPTPPVLPPDTAPNPFTHDSTVIVSYNVPVTTVPGSPYPAFVATYISQRIELCRMAYFGTQMRPFPAAVQWRFITDNPPFRFIGPSERGEHCVWLEALQPGIDLGRLGVRSMRQAE
jgi:hypothetical protein